MPSEKLSATLEFFLQETEFLTRGLMFLFLLLNPSLFSRASATEVSKSFPRGAMSTVGRVTHTQTQRGNTVGLKL